MSKQSKKKSKPEKSEAPDTFKLRVHCSMCRKDLEENQFKKTPLGFIKVEGKKVPNPNRFSVSCLICGEFLSIIDGNSATYIPGASAASLRGS